ncbi:MAG: hypothetical protein E7Z89_01455 [Cyanobacteria bacterium SIG28]|nr:hypothetical protein [Cyanobacteria bacterium SIG28]
MKKILTCAALSVFLLSGCSFNNKFGGIIKVNDSIITKAEFDKTFDKEIDNSVFKNFGGAENFKKTEDNVMYRVFREKVVKELIIKALIEGEIEKRGIKVSKADIEAEMKSIIDKVGSKEELNSILKRRGVSNSEFLEDLKHQIAIKKLINAIGKVNVSDAEIEKYYKENLKVFTHAEQVRASHILISADTLQMIREVKAKNKDISPDELNKKIEGLMQIQKQKAEAVLAEIKANPDDFEKLAKEQSDDKASGERGGELGYFEKEVMVPEFSQVAFSMKPNTIYPSLVRTQYGYHIIKVTDRVAPGTRPLAKVKDEIKYYLETTKQLDMLKDLTAGLLKTAKIEYLEEQYKPKVDIVQQANEKSKK